MTYHLYISVCLFHPVCFSCHGSLKQVASIQVAQETGRAWRAPGFQDPHPACTSSSWLPHCPGDSCCPRPGQPQMVWKQTLGTAPQGSRGWKHGLWGRVRERRQLGLGGGPERKAPGPDWNKVAGAQPGSIDLARCSSHQAGPAPGRLPVFPGVGTPWGDSFSCGCGASMPPSTWGGQALGALWQGGGGALHTRLLATGKCQALRARSRTLRLCKRPCVCRLSSQLFCVLCVLGSIWFNSFLPLQYTVGSGVLLPSRWGKLRLSGAKKICQR